MSWCLSCHRDIKGEGAHPERHLVDRDKVTQLKWVEEVWMPMSASNRDDAAKIAAELQFMPPENCGACHY